MLLKTQDKFGYDLLIKEINQIKIVIKDTEKTVINMYTGVLK